MSTQKKILIGFGIVVTLLLALFGVLSLLVIISIGNPHEGGWIY